MTGRTSGAGQVDVENPPGDRSAIVIACRGAGGQVAGERSPFAGTVALEVAARLDLNVEYVEDLGPTAIAMRVHERGVGETRSCGTGACAAVVAASLRTGLARDTPVSVTVPGGDLTVTWRVDGHVVLTGPAVLLAEGTLLDDWLHDDWLEDA